MSPETASKPILKGIGMALLGFAIFSLHDALIKSTGEVPVFQVVFFVILSSFVPFTLMLALDTRERSLRPNLPGLVALRCLFTVGGLLCAFYAFSNLAMAEVYSLLFSAPLLITLLAIPILGERVKLVRWFAIALGFLGILVVLRPGSAPMTGGHIAALCAAFFTACTSVVTRKIGSREHSVTLILYPMLTNIVVSGVLCSFVYVPMAGETFVKLFAIGLLSVAGQMLMVMAYRTAEAQFIAPMQYSQMLWAILYGLLLFDERPDRVVLMGAGIIVLSGLLFIWRELVASVTQPVLHTRNVRMAGGPQATPAESDTHTGDAEARRAAAAND